MRTRERIDPGQLDIKDTVVSINRVTKVVKGGKNLSFSALVVVGDGHGVVGFGVGKAKEVPSAIKKGIEAAKKNLIRVPLHGTSIPHAIIGNFALTLENPTGRLNNIIQQKMYGLPANYWDTYPQKVQAITAEDVQRVAQKYVDINHMQIVAVGDASRTRAVLAKFGSVQEYDGDGKPVRTASAGQ